ncbi:DNA cytosine methyltransferase [Luteolibacter sp. AS25]|uniref:DNA cytosine methyltransferase n=1 Tax=Luteolibacter sp. AS25 TaxID=3135776 RepID=UPI00398B708A
MTFASLFSGCGGFDLGFTSSGFRSKGAYDLDPEAVKNFRSNVSEEICCTDLTNGIPNEKSLKDVDVIIAGPPCQGFSTAGKRLIDDKRNHLLTLTGTLALRVSPKVLIVENVSGALSGEHAKYFKALDEMMKDAGYLTRTLRCQTSDLGMAQIRRRVLFLAWRTKRNADFETYLLPASNLRKVLAGACKQKNHRPTPLEPSGKDALIAKRILPGQKLSNVRGGKNAVATWDIPEVFGDITEHERTVLELLRRLRRQERARDFGDADPVSIRRLEAALGEPFHHLLEGLIAKRYLRRIDDTVDLVGTFNGKYRRLAWDKPSCTVDTRFGSPRYFLHPSRQRGFTVREAARIQGFPDSYVFSGGEHAQYRLIGNAVPPPLGSLAANLAKQLLGNGL